MNPCCRNLVGDPQGAGLRHPLAGMDAGVEPDGRAVGSSRAELGEKTDSSTSKSGKDSPSRALGCVVSVLHPPDTPCGFWRYLQDVQRAFLVGFPDLDLFHKAVLRCKVVQLLINLQGEVMRTLKSYLCVLPFLPESHGLIQVGSIPFHPSATGRDTFHHPKLFLGHSQGWGSHSFSG